MVIEYFLEWVETAPVSKRIEAAGALVRTFLRNDITVEEREDVEAALTILLEDAAPAVRLEIAQNFGAHAIAPRHLMVMLAQDSIDIASIALSQSPVFDDAELVDFAKSGDETCQIAVACRPWISPGLVDKLVPFICRDATYALLVNPVAPFDEQCLHIAAERFGTDTEIRNVLSERDDLAAPTRLLLIEQLGSALGSFVSDKQWLKETRADFMVDEACEKASILFAAGSSDEDVRRIVRMRINDGRMNVAYLLRAVCMGNITLVAHALSELSGVRFARVESVLTKNRSSVFKAIYERSGMPASAFEIFNTAIATWRDLLSSKSEINQSRLPFLVTKEVIASYTSGKSEVVDDLLVLLRKLSAETARESAKSKAMEIAARNQLMEQQVAAAIDDAQLLEEVAPVTLNDVAEFADIDLVAANLEAGEVAIAALEGAGGDNTVELSDQKFDEIIDDISIGIQDDLSSEDDLVRANYSQKQPVLVDAGFIGDLVEDDFDQMYAEIYGIAPQRDLSKAA